MVNFARDIDKALSSPVWKMLKANGRPAPGSVAEQAA
jgi:hypothetical protein